MTIEAREILWPRDGQAVLVIEKAAFASEMQSGEEDLRKQVEKGFGVVIYNNSWPAAYAIGFPLEQANYHDCLKDPHRHRRNTAYMESLAVDPLQSPHMFRRLARNLVRVLKERGFQRMTMHVEINNPWHQFLMRAGSRELDRYNGWQGWERTFAYLELSF